MSGRWEPLDEHERHSRVRDHVAQVTRFGGLLVGLTLVATSCAPRGSGGGVSAADCALQVRVDEVVYISHSHTQWAATRYGTADQAKCHDVGEDAAGSVFPEHPRQVTTWTFEGYPPERVLGVRFDADFLHGLRGRFRCLRAAPAHHARPEPTGEIMTAALSRHGRVSASAPAAAASVAALNAARGCAWRISSGQEGQGDAW